VEFLIRTKKYFLARKKCSQRPLTGLNISEKWQNYYHCSRIHENENMLRKFEFNNEARKKLFWGFLIALLCSIFVYQFSNIIIASGAFSYFLMLAGLTLVKTPAVHWRLMSSSMILDVLLVLIIELNRSAIATVLDFSLRPLQQAHVYSSTLAIIFYIPVAFLGWGLLHGQLKPSGKRNHRLFGIIAFVLRSLGFILMFSMVK